MIAAYAIGVLGAVQIGRISPAGEWMRQDLDMSLAALGLSVSLLTFASAVLGMAAGVWVARQGARRILFLGSVVLAIGALASSFASSAAGLLAVRAFEGIGYLGIVVAAPTLIAHSARDGDRLRALALWGTFFTLGVSLAAMLGGWFTVEFGWRGWFRLNAGVMALGAVVAIAVIPPDRPEGKVKTPKALWRLPAAAWLLGAAFLGITLVSLAILSMLPAFLMQTRGYEIAAAGAVTGLVALASLAGSLTYGGMVSRLGQRSMTTIAVIVLVVVAVPAYLDILPTALGLVCTALAVFASGILVSQVFALAPGFVMRAEQIGPANGVIAQIGSVGALSGPPLVGFLVERAGWLSVSATAIVAAFCFAGLLALAYRFDRAARA